MRASFAFFKTAMGFARAAAALGFACSAAAAPPRASSAAPILGSAEAKRGGAFRMAIGVQPATLNPLTAHDNYSTEVMWWMVETLLSRHEETFEWVPKLAESYEASKDGKTFTFQIRSGVRFHDGTELTAEDVKFSFDVYRTDLYAGAEGRFLVGDFESIEILPGNKVRVRAKRPIFSALNAIASIPIVPKAFYGNKENAAKASKTVVGTGPYRLKSYAVGDRLELEANPDWWGRARPEFARKHNFDRAIVKWPADETARVAMLEAGELDFAYLSLAQAQRATKKKPWGEKVFLERAKHLGFYGWQTGVFWNHDRWLFKSRNVRRALQLLFDRKSMNETMRGGESLLATGPWNRLSEYADPAVPEIGYKPDEARALLAKDGWKDEDGNGVIEKTVDGRKVEFRWSVLYPRKDWEPYLTTYQNDLKKAGIALEPRLTEWGQFMKLLDERNYDAFLVGRGFPNEVDFDPTSEWHSNPKGDGKPNTYGYSNPDLDRLLEAFQVELRRDERIRMLKKAFRVLADDAAHLLMFNEPAELFARSARVKFERPAYRYLMGLGYWWLE